MLLVSISYIGDTLPRSISYKSFKLLQPPASHPYRQDEYPAMALPCRGRADGHATCHDKALKHTRGSRTFLMGTSWPPWATAGLFWVTLVPLSSFGFFWILLDSPLTTIGIECSWAKVQPWKPMFLRSRAQRDLLFLRNINVFQTQN